VGRILVCAGLVLASIISPCQAEVQYSITDLGTLGGRWSHANAINDHGAVVGWSTTAEGDAHAFLYDGAFMTDLGTMGGSFSITSDINNSGHVVGYYRSTGNLSTMIFPPPPY